jgi:hypothetical protein
MNIHDFTIRAIFITALASLFVPVCNASDAVDQLQLEYRQQGVTHASVEAGKQFWKRDFTHPEADKARSCATCHTVDVRADGKHAVTGKGIKPLAPSVMSKRLTNVQKINKWFKRNCDWTLGRECSAQEKADVLMFLQSQ